MHLFRRMPSIDAAGAADLLATQAAVLVDVRQPGEWKAGHIKGAIHIPLSQLSSRMAQLPHDKTLITACRSGHRSAIAARTLTRAGHDVLNLKGGTHAWTRAGLPLSTTSNRKR